MPMRYSVVVLLVVTVPVELLERVLQTRKITVLLLLKLVLPRRQVAAAAPLRTLMLGMALSSRLRDGG